MNNDNEIFGYHYYYLQIFISGDNQALTKIKY